MKVMDACLEGRLREQIRSNPIAVNSQWNASYLCEFTTFALLLPLQYPITCTHQLLAFIKFFQSPGTNSVSPLWCAVACLSLGCYGNCLDCPLYPILTFESLERD